MWAIAVLVAAASLTSFAESYRGLLLWAAHHGLPAPWDWIAPIMIDSFMAVGELALFVALVDRWPTTARFPAWGAVIAGLLFSVAGNIGHVVSPAFSTRATAAVPPLAAAASLAIALGVLKRVADTAARSAPIADDQPDDAISSEAERTFVPLPSLGAADAESAGRTAYRASVLGGNPLSQNALQTRFRLTRAEATRVRDQVHAEQNGHLVTVGGGTDA